MAEIHLQNIHKLYPGGVIAAADIDLQVRDREFVVLVGPSGCGKSTTLRMIAGLEDATGGEIFIGGRAVSGIPAKDRDVAMVFQNYALYPHMTVRQNLAFGLWPRRKYGSPWRKAVSADYRRSAQQEQRAVEEKITEAAQLLGLTEYLDRRPKELSGGQRQRVALGRAIVRDPQAFLFDEPLSNLDAKLRMEMRTEIKRLHRRLNATSVYVTHDQEEAMTLGDRLVVMRAGKIQQVGSPTEVYAQPANRFVGAFVGTPPMNFLEGRLQTTQGGGYAFAAAGLTFPLPVSFAQQLQKQTSGDGLVLGVRPDAVCPMQAGQSMAPVPKFEVRAQIESMERLGDRTDLMLKLEAGVNWISRTTQDGPFELEVPTSFQLDPEKLHWFHNDAAGGRLQVAFSRA